MEKVLDYTCERVGYFSQVHGVDGNIDPVYRRMHIEELKKINGIDGYEKTPFDCNKPVEDWGGVTSAKPLVDFLIEKGVIRNDTLDFNVVCRSSVLTMLYMAPWDRSKKVSVRYEGRNIILEEIEGITSDSPISTSSENVGAADDRKDDSCSTTKLNLSPHTTSSYAGYYADIHLTTVPGEEIDKEKKLHKSNLYIVVKHCYVYEDGTVVNLFVSKEIDAVEFNEENDEKVSIDLKVGGFHMFANTAVMQYKCTKPVLMGFLAGGMSYIYGIMLADRKIRKVTVMDRLSAVCNISFLDEFKSKLSDFLFALTASKPPVKRIEVVKKSVVFINAYGIRHIQSILRRTWYDREKFEYEPESPHPLVIVGSCSKPVLLQNPLYHTDVVSIDNFCRRLFDSFMCEPQNIFVYGKKEEFQKVKIGMTDAELAKAEFIEIE